MKTLIATLALVLVACGTPTDGGAGSTTTTTKPTSTTTTLPATSTTTTPWDSPEVVAAMADLAARLGVPVADVTLEHTAEVTWRDGAIGCPEEGMAYTQALVPGYQIILEVDGEQYHYHGADGRDPRFCEDPQEPYEA